MIISGYGSLSSSWLDIVPASDEEDASSGTRAEGCDDDDVGDPYCNITEAIHALSRR
jgi:hypothetical protein